MLCHLSLENKKNTKKCSNNDAGKIVKRVK